MPAFCKIILCKVLPDACGIPTDFTLTVGSTLTARGCEAQTYGPPEHCCPAEPNEWMHELYGVTANLDTGDQEIAKGDPLWLAAQTWLDGPAGQADADQLANEELVA